VNFRARRQKEVELNLTPLIDVVFLLLIFFMVSTTFQAESEMKINLPLASTAERSIPDRETIEISLSSEGYMQFMELEPRVISGPELKQLLLALPAGDTLPTVAIRADEEVKHRRVVEIMDVARQARFNKITFRTSEKAAP
jgi:biopolymer transport protein ExbD